MTNRIQVFDNAITNMLGRKCSNCGVGVTLELKFNTEFHKWVKVFPEKLICSKGCEPTKTKEPGTWIERAETAEDRKHFTGFSKVNRDSKVEKGRKN